MNSKRRADLQRKLTLNVVPRPPAGLAERIKSDIPKYLDAETERTRFSRSVAFNMRVAASVLLAVMTLVVTVYLLDTPSQEKGVAAVTPGPFAPTARSLPQQQTASTTATEEVRLEIAEDTALPMPSVAAPPPPPLPAAARMRAVEVANAQSGEGGVESGASGGVAGGVVGGIVSDLSGRAEPKAMIAERDAAPAPPSAPAATAPPPVLAAESMASRTERAATATFATQPQTAKTVAHAQDEVFYISVDPQNFHRIRETLESGGRPAASAVDVEALVNYFAGPPARRPKRDVSLDVEASPAAIEAEGDHAVLRFSIDTPEGHGAPVASDVRVEVVFNRQVVANAKRVGGNEPLAVESLLGHGTSVTGLYALELRPNLHARQLVATVRLHYVSALNGKPQTITRQIHGHDLAKSWQRSSRRHRLASLGAVWGETLRGTAPGFDIARRAEELATQDPKDARARELAAAANASSDGSR